MKRTFSLLIAMFCLAAPAGATPLNITVASAAELPPLDPCLSDCHWQQVINVAPLDHEQTFPEWLADLLHEPLTIDFTLWCPEVETPPLSVPHRPVEVPSSTNPPSEEPPTRVGEAATGLLLVCGIGSSMVIRRRHHA